MAKKCVDSEILCKNLCFWHKTALRSSPNFVFSQFSEKIINHHAFTWDQAQLSSSICLKMAPKKEKGEGVYHS